MTYRSGYETGVNSIIIIELEERLLPPVREKVYIDPVFLERPTLRQCQSSPFLARGLVLHWKNKRFLNI